jgi:hypothetical protein
MTEHETGVVEIATAPNPYVELSTLALKTLIAAAVGIGVAVVLEQYVPFEDPIDVVGPPLLRGYSEAGEQSAFFGFWITTIVVGIALGTRRVDWQSPVARLAGALSVLLLVHVPWLAQLPLSTAVSLAIWTGAYICGSHGASIIERRFGPLRWPWLAVLLWCVGYDDPVVALLREPQLRWRIVFAAAMALCGLQFGNHLISERISRATLAAAFLGMLAAMQFSWEAEFLLSLSAATAYGLGVVAQREVRMSRSWPIWFLFVLLTLVTGYRLGEPYGAETRLRCGLGGWGLGAVIHILMCDWVAPVRWTETFRRRLSANSSLFWSVGVALTLALWRPHWTAIIALSLGLFLAFIRRRPHRLRFRTAVGVGVLLALAVGTSLRLLPVDAYHDGYNLTCAWEFESGRELYTEILPIRGYQFFATWLSRLFLPKTVDAYLLTFSVLQILPVVGAFALSLVWTRGNVPWSVAIAIVVMAFSDLDSRQGVHILLAAMTLSALSRDRRASWWLIGCGSVVAGCSGFDTLAPFAAATTLTLFCIPNSARTSNRPTFFRRVFRATQAGLLAVVPFSLFIAAWQGPRAAAEYWLVMRDFAAHFNAFIGLRIPWHHVTVRLLIGFGLIVFAAWVTIGEIYWRTMSPTRRRFWLFLMIQFGFLLYRGVGRSDEPHLKDLVIPSLMLVSLGIFESLRRFSRERRAPAGITPAHAGWLVMIFGAVLAHEDPTPLTKTAPLVISEAGRILRGARPIFPGEMAYVQHTVAPDKTLWTIENTTSNYANHRHLATRHPVAHTICSPSEQRRAVADMRRHPPRLIEWPTTGVVELPIDAFSLNTGFSGTYSVLNSTDGIAAPLRYYLISQDLLPRYRPTEHPGYLEPTPVNWTGLTHLAPNLNEELRCQRLPLVWGEKRVPRMAARTKHRMNLPEFQTSATAASGNDSARPTWELAVLLKARRFNYLLLTFTTTKNATASVGSTATLQFTPDQWDDQTSNMTFTCATDGRSHTYVLPVGCCPGWVWRSRIGKLRIVAPDGCQLSALRGEAWFVDELQP